MPTINEINEECRSLCDATTTSYPASDLLRRINEAYERVVSWILGADGTWQWDDSNYTDLPIGTQTLVSGQNTYSFNDKFLEIEQVEIMDSNGKYFIIGPIDEQDRKSSIPLDEMYDDSGTPVYYDKVADDTIKIYPAPDNGVTVTLVAGLRIKFRRTACVFTSAEVTTGTKAPGFISSAHYILSYMAAIPYCMKYKKDRVALYEKRVNEYRLEIIRSYAKREMDKRKQITTNPIAHR